MVSLKAPRLLEDHLEQRTVVIHQVGEQPQDERQDADRQQSRPNYQRLDLSCAAKEQIIIEKTKHRDQTNERDEQPERGEYAQGLVHRIHAHQRGGRAFNKSEDAFEKARLSGFRVGADRNAGESDALFAHLDKHFDRVAKRRNDIQAHGRVARYGAKSAHRIGDVDPREGAHDQAAEALHHLLARRKMRDGRSLTIADDHIDAALKDRSHKLGDVGTAILVVGVGIYNDVGTKRDAAVESGAKGARQTDIDLVAQDVLDPELASDIGSTVARTVIDDQNLDHVDAGNGTRNVPHRFGQGQFLIVTRDLHDQLHANFPSGSCRFNTGAWNSSSYGQRGNALIQIMAVTAPTDYWPSSRLKFRGAFAWR